MSRDLGRRPSGYGTQVKVTQAIPLAPARRRVAGDLPARGQARRRQAGREADRPLRRRAAARGDRRRPRRPRSVRPGCAGARSRRRRARGSELRVTRRLHLLLAPHGLAYLVAPIHEAYGDGAAPMVVTAPVRVDQRVRRRIPDRRPDRAVAGSRRGSRSGRAPACSTCSPRPSAAAAPALPLDRCSPTLAELLDVEPAPAADRPARRGRRPRPSEALDLPAPRPPSSRPSWPSGCASCWPDHRQRLARAATQRRRSGADGLEPDRRAAGRASQNAFAHRLSLITGGPGTGKTASIKAIACAASRAGRAGDAGRAHRASRDPDERGERGARAGPSTRRSGGSRRGPDRTTRRTRYRAIC